MGVKDLNTLLAAKAPSSMKRMLWSSFRGKKVAIDLDIVIYKFFAVSCDAVCAETNVFVEDVDYDKVIKKVVKGVCTHIKAQFVAHGVVPVVVWGGDAPTEKDSHARTFRRAALDKAKANYDAYLEDTKHGPLTTAHYQRASELKSKTLRPSKAIEHAIVDSLTSDGIITIQATAEAEELCSALCLEGIVDAVYSTDTDNLVRRCPILITSIKVNRIDDSKMFALCADITCYSDEVLAELGLTYPEFVDLSIMLGCDYNKRYPRWGVDKCFKQISEHRSIERIIAAHPSLDFSCYNYERCREIFNLYHVRSSRECCDTPAVIDLI